MGLDMYLLRKTYVKNWGTEDAKYKITVLKDGKECHVNSAKISYIEEEVGYWRKANHIHKWFVNNIQEGKDDCGTYYVSSDDLSKLMEACKNVLDDHSLAGALLPTQGGFFFGGIQYDEYYYEDVERTYKICETALKELEKYGKGEFTYYYHSSW